MWWDQQIGCQNDVKDLCPWVNWASKVEEQEVVVREQDIWIETSDEVVSGNDKVRGMTIGLTAWVGIKLAIITVDDH